MKILGIIESVGIGHASRTCEVLDEFRKNGWTATAIAANHAAAYIKSRGIAVKDIPLSVMMKESNGKLDMQKTVLENVRMSNITATGKIGKVLESEKPDLILIDTTLMGVLATRGYKNKKNTPVLFMTNDNTFGNIKNEMLRSRADMIDDFVQSVADAYLIPDVPPPYTVTEYNLKIKKKMIFIGPVNKIGSAKLPEKTEGIFVTEGKSGLGSAKFTELLKAREPSARDYEKKFLESEIVIHHGGHNTALECIVAEKPQVVIPMEGYTERLNNARKVEELGAGIMLHDEWLDKNTLEHAIEEARDCKPRVKQLAKLFKSYKGATAAYAIGAKLLEKKK
jgi:predicted glycosyltransferase